VDDVRAGGLSADDLFAVPYFCAGSVLLFLGFGLGCELQAAVGGEPPVPGDDLAPFFRATNQNGI